MTTWAEVMVPVPERVPLEQVARWWCDAWEWRTAELEAGRGNAYDFDPHGRVPRSTVRTKFSWLTLEDETALPVAVRAEMRRRAKTNDAWKTFLKQARRHMSDADVARRVL